MPTEPVIKILLFILLFLGCKAAYATTYYVDTAGHDTNCTGLAGDPYDGSGSGEACAFLTMQKASDTAITAGDTVCVNDGTYNASWTKYGNPGTADAPITFRNCEGGEVIIDLSQQTATTWTSLGGNLWESDNITVSATSLIWKGTTWLDFGQTTCADVNTQDEWCVSANGRLETYSTVDPALSTYRKGGGQIQVRNTHYIVFDGISALYGGVGNFLIGYSTSSPTGATSNITIKNSEVAYSGSRTLRIIGSQLYPTSYIYLDNLEIHSSHDSASSNGHCIKFDSNDDGYHNSYAYVTNSEIYNCELNGIQFSDGWQNGFFHHNEIYDISQRSAGAAAAVRCGDVFYCYIYENDLHGGASGLGTGIYLQELANPAYVYRNKIHGFVSSAISIFRVFKTPGDLHIFNNLIYNNSTSAISIYNSSSAYITNNAFYNNDGYQLYLTINALGVQIKNNIIFHTDTDFAMHAFTETTFIEDHNIFYNTGTDLIALDGSNHSLLGYQIASGQGTGSIFTNPLFVNAPTDLSLQATSPAINAGTSNATETIFDYLGDFRPQGSNYDIGAYEYPIFGYGIKSGGKVLNGTKFKST